MSIKHNGAIYATPSSVPKEMLDVSDLFVFDSSGEILQRPTNFELSLSACTLIFNQYETFGFIMNLTHERLHARMGAGAVIHSHSINALLAAEISEDSDFEISNFEVCLFVMALQLTRCRS